MTRWAIFLPTPAAAVMAFSSPERMEKTSCSGVPVERMLTAAFGPTPETPSSCSNSRFSLSVVKP